MRDGLLEHKRLLHNTPGLYVASAEGLHAWELASTAVALHARLPAWRELSERELRALEHEEQRPIASALLGELPGGRAALHRRDLALLGGEGRVLAIEVEPSVKAARRLQAIVCAYARARHLSHIYYLASAPAARAVSRAVAEVRATDRITVLALDGADALAATVRAARGGRTMARFEHLARTLGLGALVVLLGGYLLARLLRRYHLRASWAALGLPLSYLTLGFSSLGLLVDGVLPLSCSLTASWQRQDLDRGADYAEAARARLRIRDAARRALSRRQTACRPKHRRLWVLPETGRACWHAAPRLVPATVPGPPRSGPKQKSRADYTHRMVPVRRSMSVRCRRPTRSPVTRPRAMRPI
jgi:hypothetical protein